MTDHTAPIPVILDTDIGDDIDDTWALLMILGCPELDLRLIVTDFGNTPERTRLVAKILEHAGRTDIPIGTGVKTSENTLNQQSWTQGYDVSQYPGTIIEDGVGAMVDWIGRAGTPPVLLTIGPIPNIGVALERAPEIAERTRIVAMAGSVYVGYGDKPERDKECNVVNSPKEWQAAFRAPWEITFVPLDSCGMVKLEGDAYRQVAESEHPFARTVIANYKQWANRPSDEPEASSILFDTVAAHAAFDESVFEVSEIGIEVTDDGYTVPDESGRAVRCVLGWRDYPRFEGKLIESLTHPPT
jgi:inosine-uridine nucleoside N-ribohydrolase